MQRCAWIGYYTNGAVKRCAETMYLDASGFCELHCPHGIEEGLTLARMFAREATQAELLKYMRECRQHYEQFHGRPPLKAAKQGNGTYNGAFAFTLTKSPDDDLSEEDMIKAVRKIMNQKSIPTKAFAWYLEYGDEDGKKHPHIHGMYETESGGMIETKHWKRAWPIWDPKTKLGNGFRGGYHRPVKHNECYNDYIKDYGKNTIGERYMC